MSKTKLVLVEGIPGSGKTSTARFIHERIARQGRRATLYLEGDWDHPADYESVACLNREQYAELQRDYPGHVEVLARYAREAEHEWFFSYRRMQQECGGDMPVGLIDALARYEIYDLPAEHYQRLLLDRWQQFAERAAVSETVFVFECCFLQNPITTLLARHNQSHEAVSRYITALSAAIRLLQPKVIYLAQRDPRATLEAIRAERPAEWADFVIEYLTTQAFGRLHRLAGYDGVIEFYTTRQRLELDLLRNLPLASLALSDTMSWDDRYRALLNFLELCV